MKTNKKLCLVALIATILVLPLASNLGAHTSAIYVAGAITDSNVLRDAGTIDGSLVGIGAALGLFCGIQTAVLLSYAL